MNELESLTAPAARTDSPYIGICIRPRATIRAIVDRDPTDGVISLVMAAAVIGALANALYSYNPTAFTIAGKAIPMMAPGTSRAFRLSRLVVGPLLAVPILYINGALLRWSGSLLGGTAKAVEVRAAIAWPSVLVIGIALVNAVIGLLVPASSTVPMFESLPNISEYWRPMLPSLIVSTPLWLWWWVVSLKCLGEVHRFSAWRALGAVLIEMLLLAGIAVVAFLVIGTVQGVAIELTDDPITRALWLSFAVVILTAVVTVVLLRRYARSSPQG